LEGLVAREDVSTLRNARNIVVAAVILLALLVAAVGLLRPLQVTASPVVRGRAIDAVYATGTVEAEDRVQVKAKSSGSVAEITVKEGAFVKKGALLARIDNPVVSFELQRGRTDLAAAQAQSGDDAPQLEALRSQARATDAELTNARQEKERVERLGASGTIAAAEVDRARSRVLQLEAARAASTAQQRALRIDLSANAARQVANVRSLASRVSDTEVRAPLDGVVLVKAIELGEVVGMNQVLFKVGDVQRLIVEVAVDESDVARVHEPSSVSAASEVAISLYAFPKQVFRGRVVEVLPDANRERKSFLTKVSFDAAPPGLRSGMGAEVNIIAGERAGALLVPAEAVTDGALWVVRDGRAIRAKVAVGVRDLLRAEVLSGVQEGELVVVAGHEALKERARVSVTERPVDKHEPMPDATQPGQSSLR